MKVRVSVFSVITRSLHPICASVVLGLPKEPNPFGVLINAPAVPLMVSHSEADVKEVTIWSHLIKASCATPA